MSEAIQQDVEQEEVLSAHQSELERIAATVDRNEEGESGQAPVSSAPLREQDGEWYATAKVNGEEVQVPYSDVMAQYQKNSAADKRLQEAAERQRELEAYEEQLNQYRAQLEAQTHQPSSDAEPSPSTDATTDALYSAYHDALFAGEEAKASQLLKQIRAADQPQNPEIDINGIIERTKTEMREEERKAHADAYEERRVDAVKKFHEEFPEIASDPSLLAVADAKSAEIYRDDPTRDPWEIMRDSAEHARSWLFQHVEDLGGKADKSKREERKQAMDEVTSRNVKASLGEDEEEVTYSDIISEMRAERGQYA